MIEFREYQKTGQARIEALRATGVRRIVAVAPTGAGKSVMIAEDVHRMTAAGLRGMLVAHRLELVEQLSGKLDALGIDHGIIQASHPRHRPWLPIQVASVPTLARREPGRLPAADFLIPDECHHAVSTSWAGVLDHYRSAWITGWTATPYRLDGRGLSEARFDAIVVIAEVQELIDAGFLVEPTVIGVAKPDMRGVAISHGDFNQKQAGERMNQKHLVGDIVKTWLHRASERLTVVFAQNIEHSRSIVDRFGSIGVRAEHVDANTPEVDRRAVLARLTNGTTRVVSNVGLFTEGWDLPALSCAVIARATMSRSLWRQMAGRALRPYPGKLSALILDHGGNWIQHGMITDQEEYSLGGGVRVLTKGEAAFRTKRCKKCLGINRASAEVCAICHAVFEAERRIVLERPGELVEVTGAMRYSGMNEDQKAKAFAGLLRKAKANDYAANYAGAAFKGMFGTWPSDDTRRRAHAMVNGER